MLGLKVEQVFFPRIRIQSVRLSEAQFLQIVELIIEPDFFKKFIFLINYLNFEPNDC